MRCGALAPWTKRDALTPCTSLEGSRALNSVRRGLVAAPSCDNIPLVQTATQFAWSVLVRGGLTASARTRSPPGSAACWLCGGAVGETGWPREAAIPTTFASHNLAAAPRSDSVCEACAALAGGETWQRYLAERAPPGVKAWGQASWRSYSHLFAAPEHHECPTPERWRAILLDPPEPPFLAAVSLTGQKNLIFRAPIAFSRDLFGIQFEETRVTIGRAALAAVLAHVEALTALGIAKEQVRTGRYHPESVRRAGLAAWRRGEEPIAAWRRRDPALLDVVAYCARGPKWFADQRKAA